MGNAIIARDFSATDKPTQADWKDYEVWVKEQTQPLSQAEMDAMYKDHLHWEINKATHNWKARQQTERAFETRHKILVDTMKRQCSALDYLHWRFEIVNDIMKERKAQ